MGVAETVRWEGGVTEGSLGTCSREDLQSCLESETTPFCCV
jgi:hypothetical protein